MFFMMRKRKLQLFLIIILLLSVNLKLSATKGGPDKFGYTWKDSHEADGPVYKWFEIPASTDRVVTGLGDDNVMGPFPVGGKFTFYWYPVDRFWVGSNGYIAFNNIHIASPFPYIPDSLDNKHNFVAPMMCDLMFAGAGNPAKCLYHITKDSLIVSWINVPFWDQANPNNYIGSNSFQVILNRVDKSITFNYKKQLGTTMSNIVSGIENLTGTMGLRTLYSYPQTSYTIKFYYPLNPSLKITDGGVKWNTKDETKGIFMPYPHEPFPLKADIVNFGNQNIPSYALSCRLLDPLGKEAIKSNLNITKTLRASIDTVVSFPASFEPLIPGSHSYTTKISGVTNDKFSSNDSITQEIIVVDTSQTQMSLNFARIPSGSGQSWQGGEGGLGVYFVPPVYPVKIVSTNYIINYNSNDASFYAKIYDDKGPNNTPGKLLDSVLVTYTQIDINHKTVVPVSKDIVIYSGGVYVSWVMKGENIQLATDRTPPFSNLTFENLSGTWALYRESERLDFFIGLDLEKHYIEDIGISNIKTPVKHQLIKEAVSVSCWIKNFGQGDASNFNVFYSMDYGKQVIEQYKGSPIKPNDSVLFTFQTKLYTKLDSLVGDLCAGTLLLNDYHAYNDSACSYVKIYNLKGIDDIDGVNPMVTVFPNPFSETTTIKFYNPERSNFKLSVYNLIGNKVKEIDNIHSDNINISSDKLMPGIYTVELKSKQSQYQTKLLITNK